MKSFHQRLLMLLALGLCALCVYQWRDQTRQRGQISRLNQTSYDKSVAIEGYTNSIATMEHQIAEMDGRLTELNGQLKSNTEAMLDQRRTINRLEAAGTALTNEITQYQEGVATLEAKLKDAYDGVRKQDEAIKQLAAQRDEFVQKLNDSVKERNQIVVKYNELAALAQKMQTNGGKP